ncbi:MAG: hypothetical protein AAF800_04755 [Planctomycetota bacterium]
MPAVAENRSPPPDDDAMPDDAPTTPETFAELMQAMPAAWTLLLGVGLLVGLVLWVFGGRLAQKGVMLTGFFAGGLGAAALAAGLTANPGAAAELSEATGQAVEISGGSGGGVWVLGIGIGGAIAGVLLAWLLFRFWMAATAGALLAAVVPLAALVWQGSGPALTAVQETQDVTLEALGAGESDPAAEAIRRRLAGDAEPGEIAGPPLPATHADAAEAGDPETAGGLFDRRRFVDGLASVWARQVEEVKLWWSELPAGTRRFLVAGAGVGGVVGVVLGLVLPGIAASLQSAMVGSVLLLACGRGLLLAYVPGVGGVLPDSWRGVLLTLGLITLLGVLIQWTLRKRQDDD